MALPQNPAPSGARYTPPPTSYTSAQVAKSLAANPNASKGGYEGATPMVDPVQNVPDPYDYTDPILLKIQAGNVAARSNARVSALAQQKQLAIALGDATGIDDGDPTAAAEAANNPYSTLATLRKSFEDSSLAHDEALNKANLFYSGARVKDLGNEADTYQHNVYDARNNALSALTGIQSGLASALTGADNADMDAETAAAGRATTRAATYGYDPGAPTTSFTPAAGAPPLVSALTKQPVKAPPAPKQPKIANAYLTNPNKRG